MSLPKHLDFLKPFYVMELLDEARKIETLEKKKILHLEVGEPDFPTPKIIVRKAISALEKGETRYTQSQGVVTLREEICKHYWKHYRVKISPSQVFITSGSSPGLAMVLQAILSPNSEVLLTDPCYPCYPQFIYLNRARPLFVKLDPDSGFLVDPLSLRKKISRKTRTIMINSPCNPTGQILDRKTLSQIADLASSQRLIISDEIYHRINYEGKDHSILEFTRNAIVVSGFSKAYAMTGWRLGYVIVPEKLIPIVSALNQNLYICANSFVQQAGIAALKYCDSFIRKMVRTYRKRRDLLIRELSRQGFKIKYTPQGAFYLLVSSRHLGKDSLAVARKILREKHIAVCPGLDFGTQTKDHLRFSFCAYRGEKLDFSF